MKKIIILGVNDNPKYLYYLPLVKWAWKSLGWDTITFFCGRMEIAERLIPDFKTAYNIREVLTYEHAHSSATIAQVSRLYGACVTDGLLMTSDVDMLPLSDYWKPNPLMVNCYGRDLSDRHYPICYIAMTETLWTRVMGIKDSKYGVHLRRDLRVQENSWVMDQDIITENLLVYGKDKIVSWKRGTDPRTGYPVGRVDRSHWTLDHPELIDCHLPHDILTNEVSFMKVLTLLQKVWPQEDWKWFVEYHRNFKKLI